MTKTTSTEPKADRVYAILKQRIRELDLEPGTLLKKDELAAELDVSRAPIGLAIARLTEEGLVDVFPQHGSFVATVREADVDEAMFIRTALEVEAWREATVNSTPALIADLDANLDEQRSALQDGDLRRFHGADEALHDLIFAFIGRGRALKVLDGVRAQIDRVRRLSLPVKGRPEATLQEHYRLVEAVRMGDPAFTEAAMRAHLRAAKRAMRTMFEQRDFPKK